MTVSSLATVSIPSPNRYWGRAFPVTKVTIHHMGGNCSVETCGGIFQPASRKASSNYGVGSDGRIACYVDEDDAAWTSANWDNDNRAITIEVADFDTSAWSPSEAAYEATIDLCADICTRYGIVPSYTGDPSGTFTEHMMFAQTSCPGPWWHARMAQVVEDVKARMAGETEDEEEGCDMQAIYRPDGKNGMVWFDGSKLHALDDPDEMEAVKAFHRKCVEWYKTHDEEEIPVFEFGTKEAPWAHRFEDAVQHGFEQGHM